MSITTAMCNSFKQELLNGEHNLASHTIKLALIKASPSGTFDKSTTNFSELGSDEASGTNYTSGGNTLGSPTVSLSGDTAIVDFNDSTFSSATISADGCLIYNSSASNKAIAVIDFSGTKTATNGDFTVTMPGGSSPNANTAIIRIA